MNAVCAWHSQLIEGRPDEHPTVIDDIRDRARSGAGRLVADTGNH